MADYRTLKLALLADTSKFSSGLNKADNETRTFGQKMRDTAKRIGKAFAVAGIAIAGMAAKLTIDSVKAYSDFAEVSSKTEVIFGKNAAAMQAWAKTGAKAFGQSRTQALNAASNFAGMAKAGGLSGKQMVKFSKRLTVLASDMASFDNTSVEEAINSIGSGLRGEAEPLRKYRVLLDDATLKARAFKMGIYDGTGSLTQQQKVLSAYKEILAQTTDAQGDYGRTSDGMANGLKTLDSLMENVNITIGEAVYPTITKLIQYLNSPKGQKVITEFAEAFADAIKIMAKYLPGVVREVSKLVSKVAKQGLIAGLLSDPKIAVAAAAYGAGFIAGGPAGGAVAALAAYAGAKGIEGVQTKVENNLKMGLNPTAEQMTGVTFKKHNYKTPPPNPMHFLGRNLEYLAAYEAWQKSEGISTGGGGGGGSKPRFKMPSSRLTPIINITVNGAADSRESARAIERTLNKIKLNGGSQAGILGFS